MGPESGLALLLVLRQRDPRLDAVHMAALGPRPLEALRVGDAAARRHPVDLTRPGRLPGGEAVAVHDLAVEKIGDGRKADMRMRSTVDRDGDAGAHVDRAHMTEKHRRKS